MKLGLINRIASRVAFLMITLFMMSSLISEFIGNQVIIAVVKRTIFYALALLIICMILTAFSAKKLASLYPDNFYMIVRVKRIKCIGLNGIIFLAPLATILNYLASTGKLDKTFYFIQSLEIICGLINIFLFVKIFIDDKKINVLNKLPNYDHINE